MRAASRICIPVGYRAILRDLADLNRRSSLDLAPHGAVLDRIAFMMRRLKPIFLGRMMGRGLQYFPLFEEALDRHGLRWS